MNTRRTLAMLGAVAGLTLGSATITFAGEGRDYGHDTMISGSLHGRYGGPVYEGAPALAATASLVAAGGGASNYSTARALTSMLGSDLVNAEVTKLSKQYGKAEVAQWLKSFDFAVHDGLKIATLAGVKLPASALAGKTLAAALVQAGTYQGTFQVELLFDKALSHSIHVQVMNDIDKAPPYGKRADLMLHIITNQAFYDVAQALGDKSIRLAALH